jgi:prepilin-type N-terminal cleavage/methylation domain-containing protein
MKRAFTLVEMLVVMAIVAILFGVLLPVLAKSRREAHTADNISNLRQLGQAAQLYHEQNDRYPWGTIDLVQAKLVPPTICASHLDSTPKGISNEIADYLGHHARMNDEELGVSYKSTYAGPREYRMDPEVYKEWVTAERAGGWLVDLTSAERGRDPDYITANGVYRRLLFDGSVATRKFFSIDCAQSAELNAPCRTDLQLFLDPDAKFLAFKKHS